VAVGGEGQREPLLRIGAWYVGLWQRMSAIHRACVVAVIIVVSTYGVSKLDVNDNVSVLQSRPDNLLSQERAIADILGAIPSNTFLLLRAATDEQLLQLEERVRVTLDEAIADDNLYDYLAVSRAVPSLARQVRSSLAYDQLVRHRLPGFLAELGLRDDEINAVAADFPAATSPLTVDQWLDDPASATSRRLWIGAVEGVYASIVLLQGVEDSAAIRAAMSRHPGVEVVDQAADLSVLLGAYRNRVTVLLAGAYVVIWLLLAIRFGFRRSAILVLPPVLAGLAALGAGAAFGYSLNLFNMLALILVLGIGIDFTLFIAEARESLTGTAFAITLSALTTILSFGLLAVSATYAVSAFGFTVLVGIAGAYLLAPMAVHARTFAPPQ
jgi:predicted exporter